MHRTQRHALTYFGWFSIYAISIVAAIGVTAASRAIASHYAEIAQ